VRAGRIIRLVAVASAIVVVGMVGVASAGNIEINEFARSSQNVNAADTATRRLVLEVAHPNQTNHYGGTLKFGPDGFLYAGTGDGGGAGDPTGNARNLSSLLGKLLRLDVAPGARGTNPYAIPGTNPSAGNARCTGGSGSAACPEVVASGLRNPFRFSFDSQPPNDLWIGDVGQDAWEEIDHIAVADLPGTSFGWDCKEGNADFSQPTPATGCPPPNYVGPLHVYANPSNASRAVTGGVVVHDPALTPLVGRYLYTDFFISSLRSLDPAVGSASDRDEPTLALQSVAAFGEDAAGHVYVVSLGGAVRRVACSANPCTASDLTLVPAYTDSATNPVNTPISVAAPPGDPSRLFIVERGGRIRVAVDSGSGYVVQNAPFLDLHTEVNGAGEGGMLSMAFDPDYAMTGLFYIYFVNNGASTAPPPGGTQPPGGGGTPPGGTTPPSGGSTPPADNPANPTTQPATVADLTAPLLRIRAARVQDVLRRKVVRLSIACNEACIVRTTARIRGGTSGRASAIALRSVLQRLTAGKRVVVQLRASARVRRALARHGAILVTMRARDAAGNLRTASKTVRVKRR
jgi:hypothetical protein